MLYACHKTKEEPADTIHSLLRGLPTDTKLPNQDTTGAFAYVIGTIGDLPFSMVADKDSVAFIDYASGIFFPTFDTIWKIRGVGCSWGFNETKDDNKKWKFVFSLPSLPIGCTEAYAKQYRIDQTTLRVFTNVGDNALSFTDSTRGNQYAIDLHRIDSYITPITYPIEDHSISTRFLDQKISYVKLVSVKRYDYIPNTNFHYEMIYEFDVSLGYDNNYPSARMKGKARFWLQTIGR